MTPIVAGDQPLTLIGGVRPASGALDMALKYGETVVCADGGADWALWAELDPVAVIGDLDSISPSTRATFADVVHPVSEQESTDFDKALRHIEAPLVLGVGFSGGRIDHELGSLTVLARHADRRCILIGEDTITLLCPPQITLALEPGTAVSLFPLGPVGCDSTGLQWPTKGLRFAPDGQIGTLNKATGAVTLQPDAPKMVLILPRSAFEVTVQAMLQGGARWPVRAE